MSILKNVGGQKFAIFAINTLTGDTVTGDASNITAEISIDAAASAASSGAISELDNIDHPGIYTLTFSTPETNGDMLILTPVSSTTGVSLDPYVIYTESSVVQTADHKAAIDNVVSSGQSNWTTATGFSTSAQVDAVVTTGEANWTTAAGFATTAQADNIANSGTTLHTSTDNLIHSTVASGEANWTSATGTYVPRVRNF